MKSSTTSGMREQYQERKRIQIWEAMLDLLDRMPFREITIQKICDATNMYRTTFYNHFYDIYDLLDFGTTQILSDWNIDSISFRKGDPSEMVSIIVQFLNRYRNAIINISETKYKDQILAGARVKMEESFYAILSEDGTHLEEMQKKVIAKFLSGGFEKLISDWTQNSQLTSEELEKEIQVIVTIIQNLMNSSYEYNEQELLPSKENTIQKTEK